MSGIVPPEFEEFVMHELATGNYRSADEVVSDGLRLLRERKLYELRREIEAGIDQLHRREGIELENEESLRGFFEDIKRRGRERLELRQSEK